MRLHTTNNYSKKEQVTSLKPWSKLILIHHGFNKEFKQMSNKFSLCIFNLFTFGQTEMYLQCYGSENILDWCF